MKPAPACCFKIKKYTARYLKTTKPGHATCASHNVTGKLVNLFRNTLEDLTHKKNLLNKQELQFFKMSCSELTYKEIAVEMQLSPRAVDALRDQLFNRLDVKSR
jgi:two-component system, NarL family, invasion response regulator UvrY